MTQYERDIRKLISLLQKSTVMLKVATKVGDWVFSGYMPTGEPVWYNEIDDYIYIGHIN